MMSTVMELLKIFVTASELDIPLLRMYININNTSMSILAIVPPITVIPIVEIYVLRPFLP